ncbi:MAG: cytochrome c biogenesis protein CcdA [Candidatus Nanopelagicales bacterium]|nr:cytochrome c biogenesis protein CcdA [Candidatus Nanopelagicales bacterium]MDZ4250125.1 cytochrome c biogenesis protein CcdA [Candidatus Nanopelagicales bacterium]
MSGITFAVAFLAGIVSFASPCCLPMVPAYVGYMAGTGTAESPQRRVAFRQALAFVLGFAVVFVTLWASVGFVGYVLRDYVGVLRVLGGAVLIVLGLHVAGLISIPALYRDVRLPVRVPAMAGPGAPEPGPRNPSLARSSLLGVAFAAGWTPCIGPILGGIIGLASVTASALEGTLLLIAYVAGLGTPFILVAVGASEINGRLSWFRRHHDGVSLVTGGLLILMGFLLITNLLAKSAAFFPNLGL